MGFALPVRSGPNLNFIMHHSHHHPVFSPTGTPLENRTVGELVAEDPNLSRVFQKHSIDFCCQGGRTLGEACSSRKVDLSTLLEDLQQASADPVEHSGNPSELPLPEMIDHIVDHHHGFLRQELPRLGVMALRVAQVHGGHTPSLVEVEEVFRGLAEELQDHMEKEELILFPAIRRLCQEESVPMPLDAPVNRMMVEHDDAGRALTRLHELTHAFSPPPEACNTYRALFAGLAELEDDLQRHIHLENSVLFPSALGLQAG